MSTVAGWGANLDWRGSEPVHPGPQPDPGYVCTAGPASLRNISQTASGRLTMTATVRIQLRTHKRKSVI